MLRTQNTRISNALYRNQWKHPQTGPAKKKSAQRLREHNRALKVIKYDLQNKLSSNDNEPWTDTHTKTLQRMLSANIQIPGGDYLVIA